MWFVIFHFRSNDELVSELRGVAVAFEPPPLKKKINDKIIIL